MKKIFFLLMGLSFGVVAMDNKQANDFYTSIGVGVNHGGLLGITANKKINDKFELFSGVGASGDVGYVLGGRYYIDNNIRLIANYGTNAVFEIVNGPKSDYESFAGLNVGIDYIINNFSVGLMYVDQSKADDREDELKKQGYIIDKDSGEIKISIGYNF